MAKTFKQRIGSPQDRFLNSRAKIQIFGGAFANGKSSTLIQKTLRLATDYPGLRAVLGRATYPKLNGTLRSDFLNDWCPASWIHRKPTQDDNTCILKNGSEIQFRYIAQKGKSREDGSTTSNLLSATYDLVVIDQIEDPEIAHKDFLDMLGRLRRSTPYRGDDETMPSSGPRWMLLGANPAANWFYREIVYPLILFRDKGIRTDKLIVDDSTGEPLIDLIEADTYSNAENLDKDYIKTLEAAYKGQMRDRYLLGKWAAFEGLVHPGFDMQRHLLKREQIVEHLAQCLKEHVNVEVMEGYDFGNVAPSCYLFGFKDHFGRVFILDGFYRSEFNYMDQPDAIFEIRDKYLAYLQVKNRILADPAIFRRMIIAKHRTGTNLAEEFGELGVYMAAADNSITAGIAKVNAYLNGRNGIPHIVTGEEPGPLIYFADDLTFIPDEFGSYYWKRNPQMQFTDEPIDNNDHAMNTIKYLLSELPEPAKIIIPRDKLPPGYMYWREMEAKEKGTRRHVSHTRRTF